MAERPPSPCWTSTQSIDLVQINTIGSSIEIHNYGAMTVDDTGIVTEINNQAIGSLANNATGLSNADGIGGSRRFCRSLAAYRPAAEQ